MNDLNVGFIGFGRHAQANLYPSLKTLNIPIKAVSTTHEETALAASTSYNIPAHYINHKEMLEKEGLDCVFIAAKPEQQVQIVKDALEKNVHVFVEKNLGFSEAEAKEISELAVKQKKFVMVGFMKRFAPIYTKTKELISSEQFGDIISLHQTFTSRNFVKSGKEYLLYAAIHFIDLLRFYLDDIEVVKGTEAAIGDSLALSFALKTKKGVTVSLHFSASPSWASAVQELTITGTQGYVRTYGIERLNYHINEEKSQIPGWQTLEEKEIHLGTMLTTGGGGLQNLYLNGFIGEVKHFIESVQQGNLAINNHHENALTMKLYDQLTASLK